MVNDIRNSDGSQRTELSPNCDTLLRRSMLCAVGAVVAFAAHMPALVLLHSATRNDGLDLFAGECFLLLSAALALCGTIAGVSARRRGAEFGMLAVLSLLVDELFLALSVIAMLCWAVFPSH